MFKLNYNIDELFNFLSYLLICRQSYPAHSIFMSLLELTVTISLMFSFTIRCDIL